MHFSISILTWRITIKCQLNSNKAHIIKTFTAPFCLINTLCNSSLMLTLELEKVVTKGVNVCNVPDVSPLKLRLTSLGVLARSFVCLIFIALPGLLARMMIIGHHSRCFGLIFISFPFLPTFAWNLLSYIQSLFATCL